MATDRRVLSGVAALAYAAVVWGLDRAYGDIPPAALVASSAALFGVLAVLLGRRAGVVAGLLVAACLDRYAAEIAGATVRPEHLAAPLAAVALLPDTRKLLRELDAVSLLLLGWLGWSVVGGLLNAPDPGNSTRLWAMLLLAAFPFFVVTTLARDDAGLRRATDAWLLAGIVAGAYGIATHLAFQAGFDLGIQVNPHTADATVTGTFHEANLFGSAMTVVGLTGIGLLALGDRTRRLAWPAALTGLLAVQVSLTRTAWIAFMAGLVLIAGVTLLRHWRLGGWAGRAPELRPLGALAMATLAGTALLWFSYDADRPAPPRAATGVASTAVAGNPPVATPTPAPTLVPIVTGTPAPEAAPTPAPVDPDVGRRVGSIADMNDASIRVRMAVIRRALRDWRAHPVAGLGVGSFGQQYITTSYDRAWISNIFVRVLHDSGAVGFGLFLGALGLLGWRTLPLVTHPRAVDGETAALALGVAICAMFIAFLATEGFQLAWYWFAFGLFAASVRVARAEREA